MRIYIFLGVLLAATAALSGETPPARTPAQIRQEMTAIRRATSWENPAAAKEANERIAKLADELLNLTKRKPSEASPVASDLADPSESGIDPAKVLSMLRVQMAKAVAGGKASDVLLGEKMREEIVEQYKADVDPAIKCPEVFTEQKTLMIDFSSRAAEAVVAQMEKFRGIKTLILTGGASGAPVDLPAVLSKAKAYPLRELYIINFQHNVTTLPPEVTGFPDLEVLAVFGNAIANLPADMRNIQKVETLLADANPLATVLPAVRSWPKLSRLGIAGTHVSADEISEIKMVRPDCEVLTQ